MNHFTLSRATSDIRICVPDVIVDQKAGGIDKFDAANFDDDEIDYGCLEKNDVTLADILGKEYAAKKYALDDKEKILLKSFFHLVGGNMKHMQNILRGAYVVLVGDKKLFYEQVRTHNQLEAQPRSSSHTSQDTQYGVSPGSNLRSLLVGTTKDGDSWFQLERSPWGKQASFADGIRHARDYLKYKFTGKNQGPLGSSVHTDRNPMQIEAKNPPSVFGDQ